MVYGFKGFSLCPSGYDLTGRVQGGWRFQSSGFGCQVSGKSRVSAGGGSGVRIDRNETPPGQILNTDT